MRVELGYASQMVPFSFRTSDSVVVTVKNSQRPMVCRSNSVKKDTENPKNVMLH